MVDVSISCPFLGEESTQGFGHNEHGQVELRRGYGVKNSHTVARLLGEERWDELGQLLNSHLVRIGFSDPQAWPRVFTALPESWLDRHPRHQYLRAILDALPRPFTVIDVGATTRFAAWLDERQQPLARDLITVQLGRLQYARALGNSTDALAAVEAIEKAIREASEYTDFDDFLPSVFIPVGATLLLMHDTSSAVAAFSEAVRWSRIDRGHPVEPHALNYLALAHTLNGDHLIAGVTAAEGVGRRSGPEGSFAHLYESAGLFVPALLALASLNQREAARAIAAIDRPANESELWALAVHARARYALMWGNRDDAVDMLERVLVSHRALSGADTLAGSLLRADLADLYQSLGKLKSAERVLNGYVGTTPHPALETSRLRLLALRADHDGVIERAHALIEHSEFASVSPTPAAWYVLCANAALATGEESAASEYTRQAGAAILRRGAFEAVTEASSALMPQLLAIVGEQHRPSRALYEAPTFSKLTPRETDILRALSSEGTLNDLAAELYLSVNTLKTHLRNLYRKLGVQSREQAVRIARDYRLL